MRILIFGGTGMLGHKLVQQWKDKFEVWTTIRCPLDRYESFGLFDPKTTIQNVDAEEKDSIRLAFERARPDVAVNCIGIIKQIPSSRNVIKTLMVNSIFPHRLVEIASQYGSRLITISTDCVFNGKKGGYTETDTPDAEDLYGRSKNLGEVTENNCLTLRTSIIGRELETAHSLFEWFLSNRGGRVKGYKNAIYTGFPTIVLADIMSDLIENHRNLSGLYHVSSEPIDKYRLLCLIREVFKLNVEIEPFQDFQIDRSLNSDKFRKITGFQPEGWKTMIERMAGDPMPYEQIREKLIKKL